MIEKKEEFKNMLIKYDKIFKNNRIKIGQGPLYKEKINKLLNDLDIKKINSDYYWFLLEYGCLSLNSRFLLGYIDDNDNFVEATFLARMSSKNDIRTIEYGPYTLNKEYIVIDHDNGDGETDLIMNINTGKVYWENNYYDYDPFEIDKCVSFIDFLIDSLLSSVRFNDMDPDDFLSIDFNI